MKYLSLLAVFSPLLLLVPSAPAQSVGVKAIPQLDCPVVVEQQENARDGSLTTADFKNFSTKTVDSIRIGWIEDSGESSKPSEAALGRSMKLGSGLISKGRITVPAAEFGLPRGAMGRLKFYVASGFFSDGTRFVCSAKAMQRPRAEDGHVVGVHALR